MELKKQVEMKEYKFEDRGRSRLKTICKFLQFWSMKIPQRGLKQTISKSNILTQVGSVTFRLEGRHQVSCCGESRVRESRRVHIENFFLTYLDYQKPIARNGKDSYYHKVLQKQKPFDCDFGGRDESCSYAYCFCLDISDCQYSDSENTILHLSHQKFLQN